jgi:hypothetical protein
VEVGRSEREGSGGGGGRRGRAVEVGGSGGAGGRWGGGQRDPVREWFFVMEIGGGGLVRTGAVRPFPARFALRGPGGIRGQWGKGFRWLVWRLHEIGGNGGREGAKQGEG